MNQPPSTMTDQELIDMIDSFRDMDEAGLLDTESKQYWEECEIEYKSRRDKNQTSLL